ncbi:lipocalin family protein [Solilutibacter tolerans]|uniref:Outer membrane lipoprotein Blc n=1 Tax=Solilutibacter tolerans TaxID=1604334 RepID=A0A1N6QGD5_9GAMM|nr:apolipoprotein D and lipocalin family protein [Lysobacter tolerans]
MFRSCMIALCLLLPGGMAMAQPATLPNQAVSTLNLERYSGQWHEIAHLPMFFQRKCVANITATYTLRDDGQVDVRNACDQADGERIVSQGRARRVPDQPGQLEVRFAPAWLSWLPMTWADYWVIEIDPDYQWAVVGGPSRDYLWVLSRTPQMARADFEAIRQRAAQRGYPVARLVLPRDVLR